eukprot:6199129-Prymnesium_polylepis.1
MSRGKCKTRRGTAKPRMALNCANTCGYCVGSNATSTGLFYPPPPPPPPPTFGGFTGGYQTSGTPCTCNEYRGTSYVSAFIGSTFVKTELGKRICYSMNGPMCPSDMPVCTY